MGEIIFGLFTVVLILGLVVTAITFIRKSTLEAHENVGIRPGDSMATMVEKTNNYHRVVEAVRIFNELKHADSLVPILDENTRDDINSFLTDYYKSN